MSERQTKLNELLVDEEELNEELLYEVLSDLVQIGKNSGRLVPKAPFRDLNSRRKVVVVLLAQKAKKALDLAESEWMTPSEISEISGIKKNTVYPAVRHLEDDAGLAESEDGSYHIPSRNLNRARDYIRRDAQ
ncbi:MAG: helix-turn-helix domain-containing protein [Halorientalis sp.]